MRIATYLRVSTSDQTVEAQRLELAAWLRGRGWPIGVEFSDIMSGAKGARPGLDALMAAVGRGEIDTVVCVKLDRMGRSLSNLARLVETLAAKGVALICTSQGIDTTKGSASGSLQLSILGAFAAYEREMIRERTRAGLAVARAAGKVLGRPSPKLVGVDRVAVIRAWQDAGGKDYRALGRLLGGVSGATAWRLAGKVPARVQEIKFG